MMEVRAWGLSEVGLTRRHNEDAYDVYRAGNLYLVADGMGGHNHGEVASRTAVDAIRSFLDSKEGTAPLTERLRGAVYKAHEQVLAAIRRDGSLLGMGTTVVALLVEGATAAIAHVGDSRAYRLREGRLELLTEDHTWVHEQVVAGFLSEEQARLHPLKNVVTRALGSEGEVRVDVREERLEPEDRYLLCSDGLTTVLDDEEIATRLERRESPEGICRRLVGEVVRRGGFDDVTVVLVEVTV